MKKNILLIGTQIRMLLSTICAIAIAVVIGFTMGPLAVTEMAAAALAEHPAPLPE